MNADLLKRLGNMDQLAGIRLARQESGAGAGGRLAHVWNAAGLSFTVLPDKCLDVYDFSYKGVNVAFHSRNGATASTRFSAAENEFFGYWAGGMLATCGLASVGGADGSDPLCYHPIHGRIGYQGAESFGYNAAWEGDDYALSVEGTMRETRLYGRSLELRRTIRTTLYANEVTIADEVTNFADAPEPVFLLYHFNFGWPLLSAESVFFCSPVSTSELSDTGESEFRRMREPADGAPQQTFLHTPLSGGEAVAGVYNPKLQLAAYIKFDTARLPYLLEWRCLKSHDYVLGIEPLTCPMGGRAADIAAGRVPILGAYETRRFGAALGVLEGAAARTLAESVR